MEGGTVVGVSHRGQTTGSIALFDLFGDINKKLPDEITSGFGAFIKVGFAFGTLTGIAAVVGHDVEIGHPHGIA